MDVELGNREAIRELVDRIPDEELRAAHRFLEFLAVAPAARALLNAEPDDEPLTDQDRVAIRGAEAEIKEGRTVSHDEGLREYGWK